jgi:Family of unknown function (DUF6279)
MKNTLHRTNARWLWLLALSAVLVLGACSVARLAYNNAPTVLNYFLDDYFDLTNEQETWLTPRWKKLVEWHRENELPIYKKLLLQSKEKIDKQVVAADINALYLEGRATAARCTEFFLPDVVAFVAQLTPAQINYLERKFAKDDAKLAKEIARPLDKRKKDRITRYLDRFEDQFGRLSTEQTAKITQVISGLAPYDELRLEDRQRVQTSTLKMLRENAQKPQVVMDSIRSMVVNVETNRSPAYQAVVVDQAWQVAELTAWLINNASPKQKAKLVAQLDGYVADITGLLKP